MTQPASAPAFSYDQVIYDGICYRETHPDHLWTVGRVFGMTPPDFRTARVLELGCGEGSNALPWALAFPQSTITAIDLSKEEIRHAERLKKTMKAKNVTFAAMDIMDIGPDFGTFDYIICHGVFSWVPDAVREKILEICRVNMAPNGMALISYNVLPGWHVVGALRDAMRYHAQTAQTPQDRVTQGRGMLNFLSACIPQTQGFWSDAVAREVKTLAGIGDSYVFHDHLSDENTAFHLHEFADRLPGHGLQYAADANLSVMYLRNYGDMAVKTLSRMGDPVRQEQYLDFIACRRFRHSIVVHANTAINRAIDPKIILDFEITANMTPDAHTKGLFHQGGNGRTVTLQDPATAALFATLCANGRTPVTPAALAEKAARETGLADKAHFLEILVTLGMDMAFSGFINLSAGPQDNDESIATVSKKPLVAALARQQAAANPTRRGLTTATRNIAYGGPFTNHLAILADGKTDTEAIVAALSEKARNGELGPGAPDAAKMEDAVNETLLKFAAAGLLVG